MLSERLTPELLAAVLIPRNTFRPFPQADDRGAWSDLPDPVQKAHIERAAKALDFEWPAINAWHFLDFVRTGRQDHDIDLWHVRRTTLCDLVIAECIEGEGRFIDDIVNGIWAICEESYWGVSPHIGAQKAGAGLPDVAEPTVDLFAAETSALLAWTHYLIGPALDAVSPLIRRRIELEVQRRVLTPVHERDDFWWMGLVETRRRSDGKDWNPWICSNWLVTTLLLEKDSERRIESVAKMLRCVDKFIDPHPRDGGCDEGPGYWGRAGASLFECLDWLGMATDDEIDVFSDPLIGEIGKFIYRAHIDDLYFVNFADAPPILLPSSALTFVYGKRINDTDMMSFGAWAAAKQGVCNSGFLESIGRQLRAVFNVQGLLAQEPLAPMPRDVWLPDIQVAVSRDTGGSSDGLYIAVKGGHNEESHNHNDIGSFIVFSNGRPLIVDAGVETYTRKTFSAERYDIWTMQSAYHSLLPTVDGNQQAPGPEFEATDVAYNVTDAGMTLNLDISNAYPVEAGIASWERTIRADRRESITVVDSYTLLKQPTEITCSLLTPCEVAIKDDLIRLTSRTFHKDRTSGSGTITFDPSLLGAATEEVPIEDPRLGSVWGDSLYRVVFRWKALDPSGQATYRVSS